MIPDQLLSPIPQQVFAALVGVSQGKVSQLVADGVLQRGDTGHGWLTAYVTRLREQAAGRYTEGELDLTQERAALARAQREAQEIKNAVARGEFAPVGLLADVLGQAASAVVDRFDQLEGALRKACPDLPDAARAAVLQVIASARNEWARATAELVAQRMGVDMDDEDPAVDPALATEEGVA